MRKLLARLKKDERGLTLVEMLAVIVILAIVAGIAFVMIGNVMDNAKKDAHVSNGLQLIAAAKLYEATEGSLPSGGLDKTTLAPLVGKVYDPWGKKEYSSFSVTKDSSSGVYTAALQAADGVDSGCNLSSGKTEDVLIQGRAEACK